MTSFLKTLIFTITLLYVNTLSAQDYSIKYGVNDCINCSANLYKISKIIDNAPITFIFPENYKNDSLILIDQINLKIFNYSLLFSDSAYKKFDKSVSSYFFIADNNKLLKKFRIVDLDFELFTNAINKKNHIITETNNQKINISSNNTISKIEPLCIKENSDNSLHIVDNNKFIRYNALLKRYNFYDYTKNTVQELLIDQQWDELIYKTHYKEDFESKYEFYKEILAQNHTIATKCEGIRYNNGKLYFLCVASLLNITDSINKKLSVSYKKFIVVLDINTNSLENCVPVDYEYLSSNFFIQHENNLYISNTIDIERDSFIIVYEYQIDNENVNFTGEKTFLKPENYKKYEIGNHFMSVISSKQLFTFPHAEKIYDISKSVEYLIPVNQQEHVSLENLIKDIQDIINKGERDLSAVTKKRFTILDLYDGGHYYKLLYRNSQSDLIDLKVSKIDNNILNEKTIHIEDESVYFSIYYYNDGKQLIYLPTKQFCYKIIDL